MNLRSLAVVVAVALGPMGAADAGRLLTYEFVPSGDRPFGLRGGLLGADVRADVAGTFEVFVEDDGSATIRSFDAWLVDVTNAGNGPTDLAELDLLADRLFVSPEGAEGAVIPNGYEFNSYLNLREGSSEGTTEGFPIFIFDAVSRTSIELERTGPATGKVWVESVYGWPLDNPTYLTTDVGLEVRLVPIPEPNGITLIATAGTLLWVRVRSVRSALSA